MALDIDRLAAEVVRGAELLIKAAVDRLEVENEALRKGCAALTARLAEIELALTDATKAPPMVGEDVIRQMVADAVAALPPAEPGKDADPEVIRQMVTDAVAALPPAEPGKDADPEVIRQMVDEAVAALPPAEPGKDGSLPIVKEWSDRVHYAGECVTLQGSTWQAVCDTGRAPPHADWICLAAAGQDGRTPLVRGTHDPDESYSALDVVALNGGSFIARHDDPGPCPGEGWQLIAARGKPGMKGDRADPAATGYAIVSASVSPEGLLSLQREDGKVIEADFYDVLRHLA